MINAVLYWSMQPEQARHHRRGSLIPGRSQGNTFGDQYALINDSDSYRLDTESERDMGARRYDDAPLASFSYSRT